MPGPQADHTSSGLLFQNASSPHGAEDYLLQRQLNLRLSVNRSICSRERY